MTRILLPPGSSLFAIMPPDSHLDHHSIVGYVTSRRIHLPSRTDLLIFLRLQPAFMHMGPRKTRNVAWHSTYTYAYARLCQFLINRSTAVNHAEPGRCYTIHQTFSANKHPVFTFTRILNSTRRLLSNPLPSIFLFPWQTPRINSVPCLHRF